MAHGTDHGRRPLREPETELRRGSVIVAVLAQLRAEHYGYALRKALEDQGLPVDEDTLYPLLRRPESQGLLVSEWREEDRRRKRFYRIPAPARPSSNASWRSGETSTRH